MLGARARGPALCYPASIETLRTVMHSWHLCKECEEPGGGLSWADQGALLSRRALSLFGDPASNQDGEIQRKILDSVCKHMSACTYAQITQT